MNRLPHEPDLRWVRSWAIGTLVRWGVKPEILIDSRTFRKQKTKCQIDCRRRKGASPGTVAGDNSPEAHKRKFPTCSSTPVSVDQC
jgi:hypothetical protein